MKASRSENNAVNMNQASPNTTNSLNWVMAFRTNMVSYHNHKEQMAYAATTLYLGGAAALIFGQFPKCANTLAVIGAGVIGILLVGWQLYNRRLAAEMVDVCTILATRWLQKPPSTEDLEPRSLLKGSFPKAFVDKANELPFLRASIDQTEKQSLLKKSIKKLSLLIKVIKGSTWSEKMHILFMIIYGILAVWR